MMFNAKYNNYNGTTYQGRLTTHIVLGGRTVNPTKENIGCIVIHDIGHILMYKALNCTWDTCDKALREYKNIRR